jgi:hypothetical protein
LCAGLSWAVVSRTLGAGCHRLLLLSIPVLVLTGALATGNCPVTTVSGSASGFFCGAQPVVFSYRRCENDSYVDLRITRAMGQCCGTTWKPTKFSPAVPIAFRPSVSAPSKEDPVPCVSRAVPIDFYNTPTTASLQITGDGEMSLSPLRCPAPQIGGFHDLDIRYASK